MVGIIYIPQELRTRKEKYNEIYNETKIEVDEAHLKTQKLILCWDFNCNKARKLKGNKKEVSMSGRLFLNLVKECKLSVLIPSANIRRT